MHSSEIGDFTFHHNGDFSGDVLVSLPHAAVENWPDHAAIRFPFAVIAELVGRAMKNATIEEIQEESGIEFLGIATESDDDD